MKKKRKNIYINTEKRIKVKKKIRYQLIKVELEGKRYERL